MRALPASVRAASEVRRATLACAEELPAAFGEAGSARGWWSDGMEWQRTFGRFDPGATPYCTMLYEARDTSTQHLCIVELHDEQPVAEDALTATVGFAGLGWARISRFPRDAHLPTLGRVLTMAGDAEGACEVLRYRPRKRCTLRANARDSKTDRIVKVFADDRGRLMHRDATALWQAASRGELRFDVAEPLEWHAKTRSLWQSSLPAAPLKARLRTAEGESLAQRLGQACASLTRASLEPQRHIDARVQLDRTRRYADELVARMPSVADDARTLLEQLDAVHQRHDARAPRPIHGAPHPSQWLDDGARLALIDLDRLCMGDPELDAATFVAEVEYEKCVDSSPEIINRAFLDAYQDAAGPLDHSLLAAYRAHKHLAKALKATRGIHTDIKSRATDSLARAHQCLEQRID